MWSCIPKCSTGTMGANMRQLVERCVIAGYNDGLDEIDAWGSDRYEELRVLEDKLRFREISIEYYVKQLTDNELLGAYRSQCCQQFR